MGGRIKHGLKEAPEYSVWQNMKRRCYDSAHWNFRYYGGKGVKVCDEWRDDPRQFVQWLRDNGYGEGLTIDRIDPAGDYSPANCRVVNQKAQERNKTSTIVAEVKGEVRPIAEWAEIVGIAYDTIKRRFQRGDRGERLLRAVN